MRDMGKLLAFTSAGMRIPAICSINDEMCFTRHGMCVWGFRHGAFGTRYIVSQGRQAFIGKVGLTGHGGTGR